MIEGWHGDDYLVLFDDAEISAFTTRYDFGRYLPGYVIIGLSGWDDFIVRGVDGHCATLPTVPIVPEYLAPLSFALNPARIVTDDRLRGKVKWYTQPLVFGGSPVEDNIVWVTLDQHVDLVTWWNERYQSLK